MLNCTKCELHKTRTKVVVGVGNSNANVVLVGECPGPEEDKVGIPFIGKAGKLLRSVLDSIGVSTENVFITNIVKCFPYKSLNPDTEHVEACAPYLDNQLSEIQPNLIVSLGRYSSQYFLGKISITRETGKVRLVGDRYILPVVHPSYVMRGNKTLGQYAIELIPMLEFI